MIQDPLGNRSAKWLANARFAEGLRYLEEFSTTGAVEALASAKEAFREAVESDPAFENAHFHLAIARELAGEHESAIAEFEGLLDQMSNPPLELLYNLGLAWFHLYHAPGYEKALVYFTRAIAAAEGSRPDAAEQRRSKIVWLLAKAGAAQVHAHRMLPETKLTPEQVKDEAAAARLTATAVLTEVEGFLTDMLPEDRAFLNGAKWGALNALGHAAMTEGGAGDTGQLEQAIIHFKHAEAADPGNYRIQSNLGSSYFYLAQKTEKDENLRKAKAVFDRVLAIRPNYDFALYRLAGIAHARQEFDQAEAHLKQARTHHSEMTAEVLDVLERKIREDRDKAAAAVAGR